MLQKWEFSLDIVEQNDFFSLLLITEEKKNAFKNKFP